MKLIDKEELIRQFEVECIGECCCCPNAGPGCNCTLIWEAPETELVRCGECMFGTKGKDHRGIDVVMCLDDSHPLDWWCADGKKKDDI